MPDDGISARRQRLDVDYKVHIVADQMGRTNLDRPTRRILDEIELKIGSTPSVKLMTIWLGDRTMLLPTGGVAVFRKACALA